MDVAYLIAGATVVEVLIVATVYSLTRAHDQRIIQEDRQLIAESEQQLKKYRMYQYLFKEKRQHYRINLDSVPCTIRIIDFGEHDLRKLNNRTISAAVHDISLGGLNFSSLINFPVRQDVKIELSFSDKATLFHLNGRIVRKELRHGEKRIYYGVAFTHLTASEETQIQNLMNQKLLTKKSMQGARSVTL